MHVLSNKNEWMLSIHLSGSVAPSSLSRYLVISESQKLYSKLRLFINN